jgi:hypothetical protein
MIFDRGRCMRAGCREAEVMGLGSIFVLIVGVTTFALGLAFRTGRLGRDKPWYRRYRNQSEPLILRTGTLAVLPGSIGVVLVALAVPLLDVSRRLGIAALVAGLLVIFGSFAVALRSPGWMKPRWLREEDDRRDAGAGVSSR